MSERFCTTLTSRTHPSPELNRPALGRRSLITSSTTEVKLEVSEIIPVLSELLGQSVVAVEPVGGGRNSRVYRIVCENSDPYIAKLYPDAGPGQRNRLDAEFSGLGFLWDNGLRCIPNPVVSGNRGGWAIYEYIEGVSVPDADVTAADIKQAVKFLFHLKELRHSAANAKIGPAAEACFSVQAIFDTIDLRLDRLISLEKKSPQGLALLSFLDTEFSPVLADLHRRTFAGSIGSIGSEIGNEERTLSPSDFGFHNALRRSNGDLVFLDFEYFGWDDPAKTISDFLLHPGMELSLARKAEFLSGMLECFREYPGLDRRLKLVEPLFAMKWCLILLNEFVPERLERRSFAGGSQGDIIKLQFQQLEKARVMLRKAVYGYESST